MESGAGLTNLFHLIELVRPDVGDLRLLTVGHQLVRCGTIKLSSSATDDKKDHTAVHCVTGESGTVNT